MSRISRWLWVAEYNIAENRDHHLAAGRRWRAAAASIALGLLALNQWRV